MLINQNQINKSNNKKKKKLTNYLVNSGDSTELIAFDHSELLIHMQEKKIKKIQNVCIYILIR